jgi:tRNA(fMet)-specific endonuclease VapC
MIWLFDANACVAYLNRTSNELVARVEVTDPAEIGWCTVVRFELFYGAFKGSRRDESLALLAK